MIRGANGSEPASRIAPRLWQGGYPLHLGEVKDASVTLLALCAEEHQELPGEDSSSSLKVVRAPLDDREMDGDALAETVALAARAANQVVRHLRGGGRALVTCAQGRNRSGLVTGLVLVARGMSGAEAVRLIQRNRKDALTNDSFREFLERLERRR